MRSHRYAAVQSHSGFLTSPKGHHGSGRHEPISEYRRYFADHVRGSPAIFHSAIIYPPGYASVRSVTHVPTDAAVTREDRLTPSDRSSRLKYVLQEYFVPVDRFDDFVPLMREILRRHDVNVVNVSIRHAIADPHSLLAWARTEVFAIVIYYKQGTDELSKQGVGVWTRELVDAALSVGGSHYLPYQLHATEEQFRRAYPRATEFFALKQRPDPTNKFRNELLEKYYRPSP